MRFLVDESCDVALARALLEAGNDVLELRVIRPGVDDEWVVNLSVSENWQFKDEIEGVLQRFSLGQRETFHLILAVV
jgi:hypothetical protein